MTRIEKLLLEDLDINTVTSGDITKVNLNKQDIFPLAHLILTNVVENGHTMTFNFSLLAMDLVYESKDATLNQFRGNDNEHDVLNTQLAVLNRLIQRMRKESGREYSFSIEGTTSLEPFSDRFENQVSGWALQFSVVVINNINSC